MKRSNMILRSMMFVPGHNEKLLSSASKSNADALILDLEDSVPGGKNKQLARDTIFKWVLQDRFNGKKIFIRINDIESGWLLHDIQQLTIHGVTGFVCSKVMSGKDVCFIDHLLKSIEYERHLTIGTWKIVPLIETASAVCNAQEICEASERVVAIVFGCEDFISDLEGVHDRDGLSLATPRALIALAARATGVIPIDTVNIHVHDLDRLQENLQVARKLGFEGQLCLHPKELDLVNAYHTPSNKKVREAKEMLRLSEEAEKEGKGVAVMDGKFIGPPMVSAARKTLERHQRISSMEEYHLKDAA